MSNFFQKKDIKNICSCKASSSIYKEHGKEFKYTYNEVFSNTSNLQKVDILILLEYKEPISRYNIFQNFCKKYFESYSYVIIPALGCTPKSFSSEDTIVTYKFCKERHIKSRIQKYNPRIIITIGRALYTITETKDLQPEHFFVPVNDSLQDYQEDDTWLYTPEFKCKVFPFPPLYQWISNENSCVKDCYEFKFDVSQALRVIKFLNQPVRRIPSAPSYEIVKDVKSFLENILISKNIKEIAIDTESEGLHYFIHKLYSIQFSFDGLKGYFCLWKDIDKNLLNDIFKDKNKYFIMQNGSHDLKFLKANGITNARCDFDTMLASWQCNENSPQGLKPNSWIYTYYGGYEEEMKSFMKKFNINDYTKIPLNIIAKYASYDAVIAFQLYRYFKRRLELEDPDVKNNFYNYVMPSLEMIIDVEMTGVPIDFKYLYEYNENLEKELKECEKIIYDTIGYEFNIGSLKQLSKALLSLPGFKPLKDEDGNILLTKNGDLLLNKNTLLQYEKEGFELASLIKKINHLRKEISQLGISKKVKKENQQKLFDNNFEEFEEFGESEGFMSSIYKGRLHASYKLYGTDTGRMAGGRDRFLEESVKISRKESFGVNMQNIPTKEEFRKVFLPEEGYVLGNADYDSMEVCIFSQMAGKGVLEDLILSGKDMHCYTFIPVIKALKKEGMKEFYFKYKENLPLKDKKEIEKYISSIKWDELQYEDIVNKIKVEGQEDKFFIEMRSKVTKILDWQVLYGASGFGISRNLGISKEMGDNLLNAFKEEYPDVDSFINKQISFAKKNGYVKTFLGRKRRLPQLTYIGEDSWKNDSSFSVSNLINNSFNSPVQGTSGQVMLIAMTNIWKELKEKKMKSKLLINVHDEIVLSVYIPEKEEVKKIVEYWMMYPYYETNENNQVKLNAELEFGEIWKKCKTQKYWDEHPEEWNEMITRINKRNQENLKFLNFIIKGEKLNYEKENA